jgi:hypothetical protein
MLAGDPQDRPSPTVGAVPAASGPPRLDPFPLPGPVPVVRRCGAPDRRAPQHPQQAEPAEQRQDAGGPAHQRRLAGAHRAVGRLAVLADPELHGAPGAGGVRRGDEAGVFTPARVGPSGGSGGTRGAGRAVRGGRGRVRGQHRGHDAAVRGLVLDALDERAVRPDPEHDGRHRGRHPEQDHDQGRDLLDPVGGAPGQAGAPRRVAALRRVAARRLGLGHGS